MGLNNRHIQYDCGIHIQDELFKIYTYTSPPFESIYLHTTVAHSFVLFFFFQIYLSQQLLYTRSRLMFVGLCLFSRSFPDCLSSHLGCHALCPRYALHTLYLLLPVVHSSLSKCLNIYEYQKTLSYISMYGDKQTLVPFQSYDVLFRETRGGDSVCQKFSDWTRK